MKKILIISLLTGVIYTANAQNYNTASKTLSIEEANKLNGIANPTINVIPYSQYKAQQEALKQADLQAQQKQLQQTQNVVSVVTTDDLQKPVVNPAEVKPTAPVSKPVSAQYADKSIPGTLVPIPVTAVATSTEALVPVQTAVQPKMPELKQQLQKVELETVPASVVQPAVKAPVVPIQTEKGKGG